ncbi:MAG: hypothetical protein DMG07_07695, partial [Acidobacteria bacterium]
MIRRVGPGGFLFLLVACPALFASTMTGKAIDSTGRPVPALRLLFLNLETVRKTLVETDSQGAFSIALEPGDYSVYGDKAGAAHLLIWALRLRPSEQRYLEVRVNARGDVSAESKESGAPAEVVYRQESAAQTDPTLASIRNYQVQPLETSRPGIPSARLLADVVNPFAAKKGGPFHGSLYEFHRNDNFDARNFFDPVGRPLPEYKRNQFGLTLGMSLPQNLSLFATYEGLRIIQGSTLLSHVPSPAMKNGDFSALGSELRDPVTGEALAGNQVPQSRIHPVSRRLLQVLPDPNRPDPDRNFVNNQPIVSNRDSVSLRVDYPFSPGSNFFARYVLGNGSDSLVQALPQFGSSRDERDQDLTLSFSEKITNRLLSTWRIRFSRTFDFLGSVNSGRSGLLASLGINGLEPLDASEEGYPDFQLSGYASFGDSQLPVTTTNNRLLFDGTLGYSPANHSVQMGAGFVANQTNNDKSDGLRRGRFSFNGYYSGDAFADFLFGVPDTATRGIGSDRADLRRKSWYVFARDQWKLGPRLSLSLGLTYNYYPPYRSVRDNISGFYPLLVEPPADGEIVLAGSPRAHSLGLPAGLVSPDRNDW